MKGRIMEGRIMEEHLTGKVPAGCSRRLAFTPKETIQLLDVWETTGALLLTTVLVGARCVFEANRFRTYEPVVLGSDEPVLVTVQNPTNSEWDAHVIVSAIALADRPALAVAQPESDLRERFARAANLSPSTATVEQIEGRITALVNDAESIYGKRLEEWKKVVRDAADQLEREGALREGAASENSALRRELRVADERIGLLYRAANMLSDQLRRAGVKIRLDVF